MHAEALPPDIGPESRCRLPLPNRDDLDEAGKQTFDLLRDPHGGSLAGLQGPGGLRLHSPRVAAALRPVNTYLRYTAGFDPRLGCVPRACGLYHQPKNHVQYPHCLII